MTMTTWGYARASTTDQDTSIQEATLKAAGCHKVFVEKKSGTTRKGRDQLELLMDIVGEGDVVIVTRVDRLARSLKDLAALADDIKSKGASLKATEQAVDTSTTEGKAFYGMLGVFAEFETAIRMERQLEGIAKAKANGVYKGRPAKLPRDRVMELRNQGLGATEIAKKLGMGRASVYRLLAAT